MLIDEKLESEIEEQQSYLYLRRPILMAVLRIYFNAFETQSAYLMRYYALSN